MWEGKREDANAWSNEEPVGVDPRQKILQVVLVSPQGHFDDVQRAPSLPMKAPKELKELDENKSQEGLVEIYEEEYAQKTGLASAPSSFTDEQKKEIIEDMLVQTNVPALAMEEDPKLVKLQYPGSQTIVARGYLISEHPTKCVGGTQLGSGWVEIQLKACNSPKIQLMRFQKRVKTLHDAMMKGMSIAWPLDHVEDV